MGELVVKVPENLKERMSKISEIPENDDREVKASLAGEVVRSTEEVLKELKSGKRKPMTVEEFNEWCNEL